MTHLASVSELVQSAIADRVHEPGGDVDRLRKVNEMIACFADMDMIKKFLSASGKWALWMSTQGSMTWEEHCEGR